jgi:hypothetical protein
MLRTNMLFAGTILLSIIFGDLSNVNASGTQCDRECLKGFVNQYIKALVAHKPESLTVADNVRFTENNKEIKLGEGVWKTASNLSSDYRVDVLDVSLGSAVSFFVVSTNVGIAVRLKIDNKKITQIETMVCSGVQVSNLKAASTMSNPPDKAKLNTREKVIKNAELYADGLRDSTCNSFKNVNIPFAKDCYRMENGTHTAGVGSKSLDMLNQAFPEMPQVFDKLAAVDEEMGIAVLRLNFGPGSISKTQDLELFEAFKTYGDSMHAVEAFMRTIPAGTTPRTAEALFGWDYAFSSKPTALKNPSGAGHDAYSGNIPCTHGVFVTVPAFSREILLDLHDACGRLIRTLSVPPPRRNGTLFIPKSIIPAGYFIGRLRYDVGGEAVTSSSFNLNLLK